MERYPIESLIELVRGASAEILRFHRQVLEVKTKADDSPLTQADLAAHRLLTAGLAQLMPDIPVISEEDEALKPASAHYFLLDPLDGTRSFVRGEDDFSINIGLIENNQPVFGLIAIPVTGHIYFGGQGMGAFKRIGNEQTPIRARVVPASGATIVKSVAPASPRMKAFLNDVKNLHEVRGISSAIKFCLVAEGAADIYPRFGRTMEWDTAAGQAIVEAAGGSVSTPEGLPLLYGKPGFENGPFIVRGL